MLFGADQPGMLEIAEPSGRDGHLGLFAALGSSQLATGRVEHCFHGIGS